MTASPCGEPGSSGDHHYGGWVTDANDDETYINVQMTFTKEAESLSGLNLQHLDDRRLWLPDVYIHLANMHDLYAGYSAHSTRTF